MLYTSSRYMIDVARDRTGSALNYQLLASAFEMSVSRKRQTLSR